MATTNPGPLTQLLTAAGQGDPAAHERLWNALYDELHAMARRQMVSEPPGQTLQPTALVHEAYLRLFGGNSVDWANRKHFFAVAARAMREIRIDDARRRNRLKRGGGNKSQSSPDGHLFFEQDPAEVLAIAEALSELERERPRLAEVVTHRYFAGMTIEETAEALGVSTRMVDNYRRMAKAWLHRALKH